MVFGKCHSLCAIFFKPSTWYLKFMHYHAVVWSFGSLLNVFLQFNAQTVLWGFKEVAADIQTLIQFEKFSNNN